MRLRITRTRFVKLTGVWEIDADSEAVALGIVDRRSADKSDAKAIRTITAIEQLPDTDAGPTAQEKAQ